MKYLVILAAAITLASCGKNTKQKLIGTWMGKSVSLKGQQQQIPEGAFLKFDEKNLTFGQGNSNETPVPYRINGDTIITTQTMGAQSMDKRMIIVSNDGKKLQLKDPEYDALISLEKKK